MLIKIKLNVLKWTFFQKKLGKLDIKILTIVVRPSKSQFH